MKSFTESQFGNCPLVWMFCGRETNVRMNHIREGAMRALHNDEIGTFEELLEKLRSVSIYYRNMKMLDAELSNIKNNISKNIIAQLICERNNVR